MTLPNSPALIPVIYLAASLFIALAGMRRKRTAYPLALFAAAAACSVAIFNIPLALCAGAVHYCFGGWPPPIGIEYVLDPLSAFVTAVMALISLAVLIHSRRSVPLELAGKEAPYYTVLMLLLCGFNGIVLTGDFFNLYVFLEIASLAGYGLVGLGEKRSPVAAFRYLIMGTLGASFYLMGLAFLYLATGSLNMADVARILPHVSGAPVLFTAVSLMTIGLGIKMAVFPLHGWLPDAYTYAPSTSVAILAPLGTKIAAYAIIRVLFYIFGVQYVSRDFPVTTVIGWLSAFGIIYGSIMAMTQTELKRMLAYSSVAQIGYIGMGIGLASPLGLIGAVLHVLNHAFMKACLFLVAGNLRARAGHTLISALNESYRRKMPWTFAAFTVAALSMIGVPPLAGFFSKWYLALAAIDANNWIFLAVILLSSLLNAVYFFNILERVYLRPSGASVPEARSGAELAGPQSEASPSLLAPTLALALGILALGLFNAVIVKKLILPMLPAGM
ncbi:MAG: monovalent cation/H+ antiporter subunit D family protein [Kiritimatiellae bacterium]|nr:monovalent cation/H+ antiporter subunit D family protein [Kiritimatiellia bacterium]